MKAFKKLTVIALLITSLIGGAVPAYAVSTTTPAGVTVLPAPTSDANSIAALYPPFWTPTSNYTQVLTADSKDPNAIPVGTYIKKGTILPSYFVFPKKYIDNKWPKAFEPGSGATYIWTQQWKSNPVTYWFTNVNEGTIQITSPIDELNNGNFTWADYLFFNDLYYYK